ncbi:BbrUII/HgiDII family restriction enzyme [Nonomuraea polychroma]|uniref:BbrUII/HgiDII family restriction enzyme n=1 Tax=Nonomuraea polychroma TaxID=46176 RepID=UPI003D93FA02
MPDRFVMSLSLNVLNHLGINLYSNVPAVLSEIVANAWDADATEIRIDIDRLSKRLVVEDNGTGMTFEQINDRFLRVGYRRREDGGGFSETFGRRVMGRKGIGKLSLLSIAGTVEIHTARDGAKHGFRMRLSDIQDQIGDGPSGGNYHPEAIEPMIESDHGTRIVLSELSKRLTGTSAYVRKRIARRFSVIGRLHDFHVWVDGGEVTAADRDYLQKIQYLWIYDLPGPDSVLGDLGLPERWERRPAGEVDAMPITGWMGTASNTADLKGSKEEESLNRVVLMVRGKLAHENLLEAITDSNMYTKYLVGELHADFLDLDEQPDIATSNRQRIIEDDERYTQLIEFLSSELRHIKRIWVELRREAGANKAFEFAVIKHWFDSLSSAHRRQARDLFGKISQLTIEDEMERRELFIHAVLAFENLRYRDNLNALDRIDPENLAALASLFQDIDEIEAVMYYRILQQRLKIIDVLQSAVDEDALERVLQEHLFDHLWLLDPSWDRAADSHMEQVVEEAFAEITHRLSADERKRRIDIRYRRTTGAHVIVELKRYGVRTTTNSLQEQVLRYKKALKKWLESTGREKDLIEVVCVVGRDLKDWGDADDKETSLKQLALHNIRVVKYDRLLADARSGYSEYMEQKRELNRLEPILRLLESPIP